MNVNVKFVTDDKCCAYSKYGIKIIDNEKFIKPVKGARKEKIDLVKYIDNEMLDILNIGKKVYFKEKINDREIFRLCRQIWNVWTYIRTNTRRYKTKFKV